MIGITHLMMDDLMSPNFPTYRTSDAILRHISLLVEIYRSSWICMILLTYKMHVELMVHCYFIMISQWSLSWAIHSNLHFSILTRFSDGVISECIDFHTIVSSWHMSDFLDILIGVFLSQSPTCSRLSSLVGYFWADDRLTHFHNPSRVSLSWW